MLDLMPEEMAREMFAGYLGNMTAARFEVAHAEFRSCAEAEAQSHLWDAGEQQFLSGVLGGTTLPVALPDDGADGVRR